MTQRYLFDEDDYAISRALISRTAANILDHQDRFGFLAPAILDALEAVAEEIGDEALETATILERGKRRPLLPGDNLPQPAELIERLEEDWGAGHKDPRLTTISQNVDLIGDALSLCPLEKEILFLRLACEADRCFASFVDNLRSLLPSVRDTVACAIGASPAHTGRCLAPSAALRRAGILQVHANNESLLMSLMLMDRFDIFASERFESTENILTAILGSELEAEFDLEAFSHIPEVGLAAQVLKEGVLTDEPGVNILLYGCPGTGKTELAKSLAAEADNEIYAVGETDAAGDEPNRSERLAALRLFQEVLHLREAGVCLLDEAEDVFAFCLGFFGARTGSKVFMNRQFETNPVPVIWIANEIESLPEAVRRRMTLAIKVDMPPARQRGALLSCMAGEAGIGLSAEQAQSLINALPVPPGVSAKALQATRLVNGGVDTLETATRGLAQALRDGEPVPMEQIANGPPFDPALVNSETDLQDLADRLASAETVFSIALHGASGTGKSAFARYLAHRLGMPILDVRGSDLLGRYVGETEQSIRAAFDKATREGQFLIIDEAEGMLYNRGKARRSFELTRVNELLTSMEAHPLPFAITTNFFDLIDPAARRRIDFHIRFDPLSGEQALACWQYFLKVDPPLALSGLSGLTPAHFARVRRKAGLLGKEEDADALLGMLKREVGPTKTMPVGFRAQVTAA